ncbi:MAG: DUF4367 domain-containing protein [Firmicutes bacterium]|nr:DUF4367 domain-containing protein [Bacillota bacterium]
MNQEKLVEEFSRDLDDILDRKSRHDTADVPPKYEGALKLAFDLSRMDFSRDGRTRERVRRRLMDRCQARKDGRYDKEAAMNRFFRGRKPALVLGTFAIMALLGFAMAFPGVMTALADNISANVSKVLQLGPFTTVMQVKDQSPSENILTQEEQEKLAREGVITKQTDEGEIMISVQSDAAEKKLMEAMVSYPSLGEAQKAVCFKVLAPEYLPVGYSLKEARTYKGSDMYVNLYYSGPGNDIILMQRVLNEETQFGFATDGPVESVEVNGVTGAWLEPSGLMWEKDGVSYSLALHGFNKEEAMKIAGSIK